MTEESRFKRFSNGLASLKRDFQDFRQTLGNAETKTKEVIEKIKEDHPYVAKVIDAGIDFLPPPTNKLASFIWNISSGTEKEKTANVVKFLENIELKGEKHFESTVEKLDEIREELEQILPKLNEMDEKMAKEETLQEIQTTLEIGTDQILERLDNFEKNMKINTKRKYFADAINFENKFLKEMDNLFDLAKMPKIKTYDGLKFDLHNNMHQVLMKLDQMAHFVEKTYVSKGTKNRLKIYFEIGSGLIHWHIDRGLFVEDLEEKYPHLFEYLRKEDIDVVMYESHLSPEHLEWLDVVVHVHEAPVCEILENEGFARCGYDCTKFMRDDDVGRQIGCSIVQRGLHKGKYRCIHKKRRKSENDVMA